MLEAAPLFSMFLLASSVVIKTISYDSDRWSVIHGATGGDFRIFETLINFQRSLQDTPAKYCHQNYPDIGLTTCQHLLRYYNPANGGEKPAASGRTRQGIMRRCEELTDGGLATSGRAGGFDGGGGNNVAIQCETFRMNNINSVGTARSLLVAGLVVESCALVVWLAGIVYFGGTILSAGCSTAGGGGPPPAPPGAASGTNSQKGIVAAGVVLLPLVSSLLTSVSVILYSSDLPGRAKYDYAFIMASTTPGVTAIAALVALSHFKRDLNTPSPTSQHRQRRCSDEQPPPYYRDESGGRTRHKSRRSDYASDEVRPSSSTECSPSSSSSTATFSPNQSPSEGAHTAKMREALSNGAQADCPVLATVKQRQKHNGMARNLLRRLSGRFESKTTPPSVGGRQRRERSSCKTPSRDRRASTRSRDASLALPATPLQRFREEQRVYGQLVSFYTPIGAAHSSQQRPPVVEIDIEDNFAGPVDSREAGSGCARNLNDSFRRTMDKY